MTAFGAAVRPAAGRGRGDGLPEPQSGADRAAPADPVSVSLLPAGGQRAGLAHLRALSRMGARRGRGHGRHLRAQPPERQALQRPQEPALAGGDHRGHPGDPPVDVPGAQRAGLPAHPQLPVVPARGLHRSTLPAGHGRRREHLAAAVLRARGLRREPGEARALGARDPRSVAGGHPGGRRDSQPAGDQGPGADRGLGLPQGRPADHRDPRLPAAHREPVCASGRGGNDHQRGQSRPVLDPAARSEARARAGS